MPPRSFEEFLAGLSRLGSTPEGGKSLGPAALREEAERAAAAIIGLETVDRAGLTALVRAHPTWVPLLGSCVGLGREQLRRQLQHRLRTAGWVTLARRDPDRLMAMLDEDGRLVAAVTGQRARRWSFADVLVERARWSQRTASESVSRGRRLEDVFQETVRKLRLPHTMRTQFTGRSGESASCDFAIPSGGAEAKIVGAIKGFDSTGSKLTDAVREIQHMASVRLPRQYVYTLVDGIGWLGRQADLRRIYDLWTRQAIDGLYSQAQEAEFRTDLETAARRLGLLGSDSAQRDDA